ncbi:MAG: hypothetical protein M1826_006269 [Phylliscum demangeonii]|nr:MAG: hypothetical protein M1826_006269 [Phylliscum demangeonii]
MHAIRCPTWRYSLGPRNAPPLPFVQRRWARVQDVRFVATHGEPDRILDRYRAKLDEKARKEGHRSVEDLRQAYKDRIETVRRNPALVPTSPPARPSSSFTFPSAPPVSPAAAAPTAPTPSTSKSNGGIKPLSAYLDLGKVLDLPAREIEYVWRLRHAESSNSLCAVIPSPTYRRIASAARRHPQFILPLPREGQGAEIHFLQWTFPSPTTSTVLFTHLAEYKLRGEYSQPHTTVTHHLDLADPKGLVLLQGQVMQDRGIGVEEAQWLLMCLQKFYGLGEHDASPRKRLLEQFSQGDGDFAVEHLLEEAEKIS